MARAARLPRGGLGILLLIFVAAFSLAAFATVLGHSARLSAPSQAAPGETIPVHGSGFAAGQSGNLTYNGKVIEPFHASSGGEFGATLTIPSDTKLDTGRISAKTMTEDVLASTTLTIDMGTASAAPSASDAPPSSSPAAPTASATASATDVVPEPSAPGVVGTVPTFDHVYVIVFENHEDTSIEGSSHAPVLNSLIAQYGVATTFSATQHPSQPNYLMLVSGSTQGVADDGPYELTGTNLFHQLTMAGRSWRTYAQGYPGNCFSGSQSPAVADGPGLPGIYRRAHNPAISFTDVNNYRSECDKIDPLADFDPAAADFELIVPNSMNSMHDGSVDDGDSFLEAFLPEITNSPAFTNSVVFITFDEGTTNLDGGGHVATIAIPSSGKAAWDPSTTYSHASILRTIEQGWSLPLLGNAGTASPILFTDGTQPQPTPTDAPSATDTPAASPEPTATPSPTPETTASPTPEPTTLPTPTATASWPPGATASRMDLVTPCSDVPECYIYLVRGAGENGSSVNDDLPSIARFFGVAESGIYALDPGLTTPLVPGEPLRIPPPTR